MSTDYSPKTKVKSLYPAPYYWLKSSTLFNITPEQEAEILADPGKFAKEYFLIARSFN